jgi:hypothetical protein
MSIPVIEEKKLLWPLVMPSSSSAQLASSPGSSTETHRDGTEREAEGRDREIGSVHDGKHRFHYPSKHRHPSQWQSQLPPPEQPMPEMPRSTDRADTGADA